MEVDESLIEVDGDFAFDTEELVNESAMKYNVEDQLFEQRSKLQDDKIRKKELKTKEDEKKQELKKKKAEIEWKRMRIVEENRKRLKSHV